MEGTGSGEDCRRLTIRSTPRSGADAYAASDFDAAAEPLNRGDAGRELEEEGGASERAPETEAQPNVNRPLSTQDRVEECVVEEGEEEEEVEAKCGVVVVVGVAAAAAAVTGVLS